MRVVSWTRRLTYVYILLMKCVMLCLSGIENREIGLWSENTSLVYTNGFSESTTWPCEYMYTPLPSSHSHTLTHSQTHSPTHSHTHRHTPPHTHTLIDTLPHTLTHSHTHRHTPPHTHTHTLTDTLPHTLTNTVAH